MRTSGLPLEQYRRHGHIKLALRLCNGAESPRRPLRASRSRLQVSCAGCLQGRPRRSRRHMHPMRALKARVVLQTCGCPCRWGMGCVSLRMVAGAQDDCTRAHCVVPRAHDRDCTGVGPGTGPPGPGGSRRRRNMIAPGVHRDTRCSVGGIVPGCVILGGGRNTLHEARGVPELSWGVRGARGVPEARAFEKSLPQGACTALAITAWVAWGSNHCCWVLLGAKSFWWHPLGSIWPCAWPCLISQVGHCHACNRHMWHLLHQHGDRRPFLPHRSVQRCADPCGLR